MTILKVLAIFVIVSVCYANGHGLDQEVCTNIQGYYRYATQCTRPLQTLLRDFLQGLSSPDESSDFSDPDRGLNNTWSSFWENYYDDYGWDFPGFEQAACGWGMDYVETCMSELHECYEWEQVDRIIRSYQNTFCNGDQLHERFQTLGGTATEEYLIPISAGLPCLNQDEFENLFLGDECNFDVDEYMLENRTLDDALGILEGGFRSMFSCIREHLAGCEDLSQLEPVLFYIFSLRLLPGITVTFEEVAVGFDSSAAQPNQESRSTVAVFGDPHMYVFGGDHDGSFVTCSAPGEQNYLTNAYVEISGTNTAAFPGSDSGATYMTAVSISVLDGRGQTLAVYTAADSDLPTNFSSEASASDVTLSTLSNTYLLMSSQIAGLALALNRYEHTYQLVLRMSDSVLGGSSGLLYSGCPPSQLIDINAVIPPGVNRRRRSPACDGIAEKERMACEFDYEVTDNTGLAFGGTSSVASMMADAEGLDSTLVSEEKDGVATLHPGPATLLATVLCSLMLRQSMYSCM